MAAYLVVDTDWRDTPPEDRKAFGRAAQPVIHQFGGRFITDHQIEHLEGDWTPPILTIVEFPDLDHVHRMWASPEYQAAAAIRQATSAQFRIVLVNGAAPAGPDFLEAPYASA